MTIEQHIFIRQIMDDGSRHPIGCLFIALNSRNLMMGASLCSPSDIFDKVDALAYAKSKAYGTFVSTNSSKGYNRINIALNDNVANSLKDINDNKNSREKPNHFFGLGSINKLLNGRLTRRDVKYDTDKLISDINHQLKLMITSDDFKAELSDVVAEENC